MIGYHLIQDVYSSQSLYLLRRCPNSLLLHRLVSSFYSHLVEQAQNASIDNQQISLLILPDNEVDQV